MKPIKPNFKCRDSIQDELWWAMCDAGMSFPVPLRKADLSRPFLYDRRYGVFYCGFAKHQFAMALLLAWDNGVEDFFDIDHEKLGVSQWESRRPSAFADYYLENTKGTCFKSAVGKSIKAGKKGNLNGLEIDYFGMVDYLAN